MPQVQSLSFVCTERRVKQDNALASIIIDLPPWVNWLTFDNAVTAEGLRYIVLLLQQGWKGIRRRPVVSEAGGSGGAGATTATGGGGGGVGAPIGGGAASSLPSAAVSAFAFAGITGLAVRNHAFKLDELAPVIDMLVAPAYVLHLCPCRDALRLPCSLSHAACSRCLTRN